MGAAGGVYGFLSKRAWAWLGSAAVFLLGLVIAVWFWLQLAGGWLFLALVILNVAGVLLSFVMVLPHEVPVVKPAPKEKVTVQSPKPKAKRAKRKRNVQRKKRKRR